MTEIDAITFDDFNTLRHQPEEQEDVIYPILRAIKRRIAIDERGFLKSYFRKDRAYRKTLKETSRESLLDDIISGALEALGHESNEDIVREAVNQGLATRKTCWYPDSTVTLLILQKKGYKLGMISNTHWRLLENVKDEFAKYFSAITLSYEHGYAKPHPSIFLATLKALKVKANQCLHVGDDPKADIQGARRVGMKTAFIKRQKDEADADIRIKKLSDLLEFLR